jgi:hypothetical protein
VTLKVTSLFELINIFGNQYVIKSNYKSHSWYLSFSLYKTSGNILFNDLSFICRDNLRPSFILYSQR